jgi:hypothetical protein
MGEGRRASDRDREDRRSVCFPPHQKRQYRSFPLTARDSGSFSLPTVSSPF